MESLVFGGDLHLYHKTPVSRLDKYESTILRKLEFILNIDADYHIFSGDFWHKIDIPKEYIKKVIELLERYKHKKIFTVIGNHDVPFYDTAYLDKSPLGILFATGFIKRLTRLETENYEIIGWDFNGSQQLPTTNKRKKKILVAHKYLNYGNDFEQVNAKEILNFDMVFLGHDHRDYLPIKFGNTWVIRSGAISRLTGKDEDTERDHIYVFKIENDGISNHSIEIPSDTNIFNKAFIDIRRGFNAVNKQDLKIMVQHTQMDRIEDVLKLIVEEEPIKTKFLELYNGFKQGA